MELAQEILVVLDCADYLLRFKAACEALLISEVRAPVHGGVVGQLQLFLVDVGGRLAWGFRRGARGLGDGCDGVEGGGSGAGYGEEGEGVLVGEVGVVAGFREQVGGVVLEVGLALVYLQ